MMLTAVGGDFRATRLPATVVYSLPLQRACQQPPYTLYRCDDACGFPKLC